MRLITQAMLQETRTDKERAAVGMESVGKEGLGGYFLSKDSPWAMEEEFLKTATKEEEKTFKSSTNWFDAMRPYFLRKKDSDMPMVFDLRRGAIEAAICYVNAGANDFNNAEENHGLCPSIMVAARFYNKDVRKENKPYLNDLLYIYGKLKEDEQGLNHEMITAYKKKHPEENISEKMGEMDALLDVPEEERFTPKTQQTPQKTKTLWNRLFGGR